MSLGRTKHTLSSDQGNEAFPPFIALEIVQYPGDAGYYLLHLCENEKTADTWHLTLKEAMDQAAFEFSVLADEWRQYPAAPSEP